MAWGWAVPWWLLQRTQWMLRVWAIAQLWWAMELWWAALAEKHSCVGLSVLINPLFTTGYMESVLPKTFDWEFVPYCLVSFLQNADLQKWGRKKKGSKDQLINHLYQWLLLLVSSAYSVFCTHIFLICKQIRLENNSKRVQLMTRTRTVHWKSPVLLSKGSKSDCKKNYLQHRRKPL